MAFITVFISPKGFNDPHTAMIQRNALQSWKALGDEVDAMLIGDEPGAAEAAAELGLRFIPEVRRNQKGTPLLNDMFALARANSDSPLLAYVNADVLLLPDFLASAHLAAAQLSRFLIVGQRWDLDVRTPFSFEPGWQENLKADVEKRGRLHPRKGSDYFIFPRACFEAMPAFAIGRSGWDNWMFYEARRQGWPLVDASGAITVIHQDHDYRHLPNGQPHYRLPESAENVRLAGGKRTIFSLLDTDRVMADGKIKPAPMSWKKFWREVEIFPLVKLNSIWLANLAYAIFHPRKAYRELRGWMAAHGSR